MSLPMNVKSRCSVCGHKSMQTVMASSNTFGYPDLDLRPAPMLRDTMEWWIQECPKCGYVADALDRKTHVKKDWLLSDSYRDTDGLRFISDLASLFYKQFLICTEDGNGEEAFDAILHCAWACDDAADFENATTCRKKAIPLLEKIIRDNKDNETNRVMKMDLLRRAGLFDLLLTEYEHVSFSDKLLEQIREFQLELARRADTGCYTVGDVKRRYDIPDNR